MKLFAITLLFSTGIYLSMGVAMLRHSRRRKCNCRTAAQIMAPMDTANRHKTPGKTNSLIVLTNNCSGCGNNHVMQSPPISDRREVLTHNRNGAG